MPIAISAELEYDVPEGTDLLLQVEAAALPEQALSDTWIDLPPLEHFARVAGHDGIGERIWLRHAGPLAVRYTATVTVQRTLAELNGLPAVAPHRLPGEAVQYMVDSAYCPASRFQPFVAETFGNLGGGEAIAAMRDWIAGHLVYCSGSSDTRTTALDSFVERRGVCRDFAHLMITLARAAAIPARFVSAYSPEVTPQDFHALAEVFLAAPGGEGGIWLMVDPTGMSEPSRTAKIAVGRDAADASFLTSYGPVSYLRKEIYVTVT